MDQFYGSFDLFNHYHMPGEGNIRGFVNSSQRGADAMVSSQQSSSLIKDFLKIGLIFLLLFLLMQGYFGIRLLIIHGILIGFDRYLGNVGFGTRLNTKLFEKELFLRFDVRLIFLMMVFLKSIFIIGSLVFKEVYRKLIEIHHRFHKFMYAMNRSTLG